jgi:hypothetical protein
VVVGEDEEAALVQQPVQQVQQSVQRRGRQSLNAGMWFNGMMGRCVCARVRACVRVRVCVCEAALKPCVCVCVAALNSKP